MVEAALSGAGIVPTDPEVALAIAYAPKAAQPGLRALWALDDTLGRIVDTTTEPMIGQMRMTWWHDALLGLGTRPVPAEPVLRALAAARVPLAGLVRMIEGWEELIEPGTPDADRLRRHVVGRGEGLFGSAAALLGATDAQVGAGGRLWASIDGARRRGLPIAVDPADLAASCERWSRAGRPLGMLARLARRDARNPLGRQGSPARMFAMVVHAATGR